MARDRHRRRMVRQADAHEPLDSEASLGDGQVDAASRLHWQQAVQRLEQSLAELRPSTRSVFLLHHLENLSYAEIAQRLGVTTRTVEREMARALSHCGERLRSFLESP